MRHCPYCQSTKTGAVVCDTKSNGARRRPDVLAGCWCSDCDAKWYDWDYASGETVFSEWHRDNPHTQSKSK